MRIECVTASDQLTGPLAEAWNDLVSEDAELPFGTDMTATVEWNAALISAFLPNGDATVLVARESGDRIAGVLPLFHRRLADSRMRDGAIALLPELYGGRVGILAREGSAQIVRALLASVDHYLPQWAYLELTLVEGSRSSAALHWALAQEGLHSERIRLEPSPYIALPERFDQYFSSLKAGFRTEVRRGERRLLDLGRLERRLYRSSADVDSLWSSLCRIEQESWKESAGTSITSRPRQQRFYREMLPRAAASGQLLSAVLYLNDRPIAHQLCLERDGTAAILKMSYVDDLRRHYPSTVLLAGYLQDIIELGIRNLDFMGVCDDFKLRWTSLTYSRTKHLVFRRTAQGRIARWRRRTARALEAVRSRFARPVPPPQTAAEEL